MHEKSEEGRIITNIPSNFFKILFVIINMQIFVVVNNRIIIIMLKMLPVLVWPLSAIQPRFDINFPWLLGYIRKLVFVSPC